MTSSASSTLRCSATMSSLRRPSIQACMVSSPYWKSSGFFRPPEHKVQGGGGEVTDDVVLRGLGSEVGGVEVGHQHPEALRRQLLLRHVTHRRVEGTRTLAARLSLREKHGGISDGAEICQRHDDTGKKCLLSDERKSLKSI
ncbi:hypothetical protein EYF80_030941 [Liparis tanakae]|uniref:Uncharacterized protein n=1 Tax=Liparis tanakae TaxID=230148 RepID=A0A4Z2H1L8_9TELE|nr:hypothetical protein EYF80_030941 [Liparis tanakae]